MAFAWPAGWRCWRSPRHRRSRAEDLIQIDIPALSISASSNDFTSLGEDFLLQQGDFSGLSRQSAYNATLRYLEMSNALAARRLEFRQPGHAHDPLDRPGGSLHRRLARRSRAADRGLHPDGPARTSGRSSSSRRTPTASSPCSTATPARPPRSPRAARSAGSASTPADRASATSRKRWRAGAPSSCAPRQAAAWSTSITSKTSTRSTARSRSPATSASTWGSRWR